MECARARPSCALVVVLALTLTACGGGGTSSVSPPPPLPPVVTVSVSPASATLLTGATQQFTATVTGTTNTAVSWSVNGITGGDPTVGTISAGLYTARAVPSIPNAVTVKAISSADSSKSDTASVTINNPQPVLSSISPTTVDAGSGAMTLTVNGSAFSPQSVVQLAGANLTTTLQSSTQLTAQVPTAMMATAGAWAVTVVTPAPGGGATAALNLEVRLVVSVSPAGAAVLTGQTQQFSATVTGAPGSGVTWAVNDVVGGNAALGTITAAGLYTAPLAPPVPDPVTIKATSTVDPSRSASASVMVNNPAPSVSSISPATLNAGSGNTVLTVNGSGFSVQSTVQWESTSLTTTFVNSGQLKTTLPASALTTAGTFVVTVATPAPGGGTSNSADLQVLLVVSILPASASPLLGATQQFTVTVTGGSASVIWSVNDVVGGSPALGTITLAGLYTAPLAPPSPNPVTVKATSTLDPSRSASASVTVRNPVPFISSISPSSVVATSGDTTLTVNGTGFTAQSVVEFAGLNLVTAFQSSTALSALIPASMLIDPATVAITVTTPAPGGGISNVRNLTISPVVGVSPSPETLLVNQVRQFTATVNWTVDQSVTWWVNGILGGNATVGTISSTGLYLAPNGVPAPDTVTVKAASLADSSKFGTAAVTVTLPTSDNYPRSDATSVLRSPPALKLIPSQGATVAVLDWTAKDPSGSQEDVLAVCHALNPWGIRHVHTTDVAVASAYSVVAVAGALETLNSADRNALTSYVSNGGTLLLWRAADSGLLGNLGIVSSTSFSGTTTRLLTFDVLTADPALHYVDDDVEIDWKMTYPGAGNTRHYTAGSALPLAHWDTGEAAMLRSDVGSGRAYIFGWRLRYVVADGERLVIPGPEPKWTNLPTLDSDIAKLLVRAVYEDVAGAAVPRQFAPNGKPAALIITHDVDAPSSYERVPEFVQTEAGLGVKSTFNFTTDPYDAGWTGLLYTLSSRQNIQIALDAGFEVESHSFGHFPDFSDAPLGSGNENASNYFPRYSETLQQTFGLSSIGELGVSRWLLENDFGIAVPGFRSGELDISPDFLPTLQLTGYVRDTTYAAGVSRGSLPFVLFSTSSGSITTYPVMEYPLAASDEGLADDTLQDFLDSWERVIRDNYKNNVPTVLLIHPVRTGPRLEAIGLLLQRVADLDLWIGDWKTFAEAWEAQGVTCDRWP